MLRKALPLILLVVASAMAHAEKVSGFVTGKPSGKSFVLGAKGGPYTVDTSKAKITLKGKFFSLSNLTGGSQVTVEGTMKGKSISATTVNVGFLRGAAKTTVPATVPAPSKKTAKTKPMVKPTEAPKVTVPAKGTPKSKTKSKSTVKAAEAPKTTAPATGTTKSKTKSKAKSTTKAKTDSKEKATTGGH